MQLRIRMPYGERPEYGTRQEAAHILLQTSRRAMDETLRIPRKVSQSGHGREEEAFVEEMPIDTHGAPEWQATLVDGSRRGCVEPSAG